MKDYNLNAYKSVPVKVPVIYLKHLYSKPKIYIPKKEVNGVLKPTLEKSWYVYYYYRNPYTGKMQKFIEKRGINREKSLSNRNKMANILRKAVVRWLQDGYNPFVSNEKVVVDKNELSINEAIKKAFVQKEKVWAESTTNVSKTRLNVFIEWLEKEGMSDKDILELKKKHISNFLNDLTDTKGRSNNNISRNNYRAFISSLVKQLVNEDVLDYNFVISIPKLKQKPLKNKPFSKGQLITIKEYLLEKDPYLYKYIQFVMYAFLRPIEVTRIQLKDVDLIKNIITVKTKTELNSTVLIIEKLKDIIAQMNITKGEPEHSLFSPEKKPAVWETKTEKGKSDFFVRRFRLLKRDLNLGNEYGIYSFRHTFALDLYNSFLKQGLTPLESKHKLMTITRHKSLSGLNNYLRDIGAELPKDYSKDFTVDF